MTFIVQLYERENGKYWPCGRYFFDSAAKAHKSLHFHYCTNKLGICGLVYTRDALYEWRGMSCDEAIRVSPIKCLAA